MRSVDFCLRPKLERYILQKLNICRYMLPYSFEDRILRELLLDLKSWHNRVNRKLLPEMLRFYLT